MSDREAKLVPTTPIEWEESLSSSSRESLQQCPQLSEAPHLRPLLRILPDRNSHLEGGCGLGQYGYLCTYSMLTVKGAALDCF